jgi:hypothetical protein
VSRLSRRYGSREGFVRARGPTSALRRCARGVDIYIHLHKGYPRPPRKTPLLQAALSITESSVFLLNTYGLFFLLVMTVTLLVLQEGMELQIMCFKQQ